jgi:putative FmdB family regulatory protein
MPIYDYECRECAHRFSESHSVLERHGEFCRSCGGRVFIVIGNCNFHKFTPHYNVQLGRQINTLTEKKEIMQEMGVMSVGDADFDEVEKQAKYNKETIDKAKRKKKLNSFMEDWPKYDAMDRREPEWT